jgi:hypothetical protein
VSELVEALRAIGVHNEHDLVERAKASDEAGEQPDRSALAEASRAQWPDEDAAPLPCPPPRR